MRRFPRGSADIALICDRNRIWRKYTDNNHLDMPKSVRKISSNFDLAVHVVTLINYSNGIAAVQ